MRFLRCWSVLWKCLVICSTSSDCSRLASSSRILRITWGHRGGQYCNYVLIYFLHVGCLKFRRCLFGADRPAQECQNTTMTLVNTTHFSILYSWSKMCLKGASLTFETPCTCTLLCTIPKAGYNINRCWVDWVLEKQNHCAGSMRNWWPLTVSSLKYCLQKGRGQSVMALLVWGLYRATTGWRWWWYLRRWWWARWRPGCLSRGVTRSDPAALLVTVPVT